MSALRRVLDRPLRIAVPKGSLFEDSVNTLEAAGIDASILRNPGRQLIFTQEKYEFVILRPTDVPTFVAFGGVDCGMCGEDSIVESGADIVEMVDLNYGGCRFVVAEPKDSKAKTGDAYSRLGVLKVATKYPNITKAYYDSIGTQVEIVKLHGNIELAPLCAMADRIVDITATGTTLRENNLEIVSEVMHSTARFIANPAAVRIDSRIRMLASKINEVVKA